ncbi:MAG: DUF47 family protein [Nitriliruptoraceae bacterium]
MKRIGRLTRELLGSNEGTLVICLVAQIDAALAGVRLATDAVSGRITSDDARRRISIIEHEGDAHRADLVDALGRALVTPFDREDLFRLSRSIDDVLDNLRDLIREYDLFHAPPGRPFVPALEAIGCGLETLRAAVQHIVETPAELTRGALAAKKGGSQVRQEYQRALADLLDQHALDRELLKSRELLRRLDVIGLRLGEAADALADGAMKRSH